MEGGGAHSPRQASCQSGDRKKSKMAPHGCGGHEPAERCDIFIVKRGYFKYNPLEGHPRGQFIMVFFTRCNQLNTPQPAHSPTMVAVKSTRLSLKSVFGLSARGYSRNMVGSVEDDTFPG